MTTSITQAQIAQFHEQSYLVLEDVLDIERDIQPLWDEYEALLDRLCEKWRIEGKLASTYRDLPFGKRLIQVFRESGQAYYEHFDISLPQANVSEDTPIHLGPAVFHLLTCPRLLDVVEQIVGPEIYSNPVQHIRINPPERFVPAGHIDALVTATDWHQDQGVVLPEADETETLTVWLPVTDATVENGTLIVIPGSHREGLALHCPGMPTRPELHIPEPYLRLGDAMPVPIRRGGALFMHRRTKHASLSNQSDDIRWSFDLRYHPVGQPTGRPAFPGFVARSRSNPASALTDYHEWVSLWQSTRLRLAMQNRPAFNRWADSPAVCA